MKVEEDAVRLQTHQRMRRSASASLPALNQRDHAIGGFLITSLGRVTLGKIINSMQSSEIIGLCLMKCSSEMLQNLP